MHSNSQRINKTNKKEIWDNKRGKLFGTGWKYQPVPKRLHACVSVAASKARVGFSNRYLWVPKAPAGLPGILDPCQWSRFAGAGWKTGT